MTRSAGLGEDAQVVEPARGAAAEEEPRAPEGLARLHEEAEELLRREAAAQVLLHDLSVLLVVLSRRAEAARD